MNRIPLLISSAALLGLVACHSVAPNAPAAPPVTRARVVQAQSAIAPALVPLSGTLHARETTTLSAQVMGSVREVAVHEGDSVRAGQTLIVLDDSRYRDGLHQAQAGVVAAQHQLEAAQSDARLATSTLERYRQLEREKSVSPQEMDEMRARASAASARLAAMQASLDAAQAQSASAATTVGYTHLRAPFSGVVAARLVDPGAVASPGVSLLQIDSAGTLQLIVPVDESLLSRLHRGQKIPLRLVDATELSGTIAEIVPVADPATHSFTVKIDLPPSSACKSGMYVTALLAIGERNQLTIPLSAVVARGALRYVYVLDANHVATLRAVTTGAAAAGRVEVLTGLSANEKVVDQPGERNLAGMRIEEQ